MTEGEMVKLCNAEYTLRCLYPMLSEENKKALDVALDLMEKQKTIIRQNEN